MSGFASYPPLSSVRPADNFSGCCGHKFEEARFHVRSEDSRRESAEAFHAYVGDALACILREGISQADVQSFLFGLRA